MYYKWLKSDGRSPIANWLWPLPTEDGPGEWTPYIKELMACESGYHGCKDNASSLFDSCCEGELYEIDYRGKANDFGDTMIGHEARLLRKVGEMDARKWRLLACDFAERTLSIYERIYPNDSRPRNAIEVARRYADGETTIEKLCAAGDAAKIAARSTARRARADAMCAWAPWAAWAVARDKSNSRDSARYAVKAASIAAVPSEAEWQKQRLFEYLAEPTCASRL